MHREYHRWYSPSLHRDMELLLFGKTGWPVLVFPTSMGRFFEFEDRGMVGVLADKIDAGHIQLVCVDSIDRESWYNTSVHPRFRIARHLAFEQYLLGEVVPLVQGRMPAHLDGRVGVTGCSLGAFHAAELALRHPRSVSKVVALSGKYSNTGFLGGFSDTSAYVTNPLSFIPGLRDPAYLEPLRAMDIVIVSGTTDPHIHEARALSQVLWDRQIPNTLDLWDGWCHDWPYWEVMIRKWL